MRVAMLELMRLMANSLVAEEAFAVEFAEEASLAERLGETDTSAIMRDISRRHRVKALELDGRLAAMRLQYEMMYTF